MQKIFLFILGLLFSLEASAFTCYLTVAKDNCWLNYNVTVTAMDAEKNNEPLVTVIIPQGSAWARQKFTCEPDQTLRFKAQYSPVFWEKERGKAYFAKKYWVLPKKIDKEERAWNITVCYPEQFSEVPLPPEAVSKCKCDLDTIPPIPPQ
ncbi:hypothetical protein [Legionella londiniensis]|uniref:Periplasmic protein n=1 Tax=Legionella londiniensis TaxID=45068 RepID=A0A0W0VMH4_9GAMM|nr:periplasmic protein [Legionella londiniensis]STX93589.1 periplasmic protein [Legionella londiniensis]